jgi:hypothetical protein
VSNTLKNLLAAIGALFLIIAVLYLVTSLFTRFTLIGFGERVTVVDIEGVELQVEVLKDDPEEKKIGIIIRSVKKGPEEEGPEADKVDKGTETGPGGEVN